MRRFLSIIVIALPFVYMSAQQLPNSDFESWNRTYNGDAQPDYWNGSNVSQIGLKFTFVYKKPGRSGYCMYVADREVGAVGITETAPGYISLGQPWQYLKGLNVKGATAGTEGGIAWKYRPDTMSVWIKRTGDFTRKEDFHLLYYAWSGTAKSTKYKNKARKYTVTERTNEESDIRQATDGNEFGVDQPAQQIAEGWYRARAKYNEWTQIKVPVFYMSDKEPTMCNVIFSAGNYPAFRANDGLYAGNALFIDDVEMIYSSRIDKLVINGQVWADFNPDSEEVQTCKLSGTKNVQIEGFRGIGSLTNIKGETAVFNGRKLDNREMTITPGVINGKPWIITVKAEDNSSEHTYKIKFSI